jgi:hypothetical protein
MSWNKTSNYNNMNGATIRNRAEVKETLLKRAVSAQAMKLYEVGGGGLEV